MRFRCPNCQQAVRVEDSASDETDATIDVITCPSCESQFDLASTDDTEVGITQGVRIEHFEIQLVLGEGTFGTVYKAWDTELERPVALKVPRSGRISGEGSRLFLREARAAASITHPNVVAVHEIGQYNDSIYIACQYIDGISLREYMRAHQLSNQEIGTLLIKILRAMNFFHAKGIIHRDIKPGNILLNDANEPFIADFGLARRHESDEITVTKSGIIVGTLGYMSPEQARGEVQTLSPKTDIYAVGVMLYEMLTLTRPFVSSSSHTILHNIQNKDPQPPRKINPRTPRDLETICLKALEKEPNKRYATAGEMADDLQRFLDNKPIVARPAGILKTSWKWIRRNPVVAALSLTTVVAVMAAAVMMTRKTNDGTLPVRVLVDGSSAASANLRCIRYDDVLRVPDASGFIAEGTSGEVFYLLPGLYKIKAENSVGGSHEVWRKVPDTADRDSASQLFPHDSWTAVDGEIVLQPFSLFTESEIETPLVKIKGGTFKAGKDANPGSLTAIHQQTVSDFYMAVNEVSFDQFRKLLQSTPLKSPAGGGNYFDSVCNRYFGAPRKLPADQPADQPVTGFPVDAAILYCELAGGRLPTNMEWEYAATQGGTTNFPTGNVLLTKPEDWKLLAISEATADTTPQGIRNLFYSAAEYTDSRMMNYQLLYPDAFPGDNSKLVMDASLLKDLPEGIEVRGAPQSWLNGKSSAAEPGVRTRLMAPSVGSNSMETFGRIGWRMCR